MCLVPGVWIAQIPNRGVGGSAGRVCAVIGRFAVTDLTPAVWPWGEGPLLHALASVWPPPYPSISISQIIKELKAFAYAYVPFILPLHTIPPFPLPIVQLGCLF